MLALCEPQEYAFGSKANYLLNSKSPTQIIQKKKKFKPDRRNKEKGD